MTGVQTCALPIYNGCVSQSNISYTVSMTGAVSPGSFSGLIPGPIAGGASLDYPVGTLTNGSGEITVMACMSLVTLGIIWKSSKPKE